MGRKIIHGLWVEGKTHPDYYIWSNAKGRCYNKNNIRYESYGKRGITMYSKWIDDPASFIEYIRNLSDYRKKGYSLDRINNNGNYEPGNLRWTNYTIQTKNRQKIKGSNNYTGVCFNTDHRAKKKWRARLYFDGKSINIGSYETELIAYQNLNSYLRRNILNKDISRGEIPYF